MCAEERLDHATPFLAWCETQGISCSKCTIQDFLETGRGVGAGEDIQKGEAILSVPDEAVLMPETCSIAQARALSV